MKLSFKKLETPDRKQFYIPSNIKIRFLKEDLPSDYLRRLAYIPWESKYLELCPKKYRKFFKIVFPYLKKRTTNVHTAVSLSFMNKLITRIEKIKKSKINTKIIVLGLILHDCGWYALSMREIANSLADYKGLRIKSKAIKVKLKHAEKGVEIAQKILDDNQSVFALTDKEKKMILDAVFWHDKIEQIRRKNFPVEIKIVADLDHIWSYSFLNFWQDTIRKDIESEIYIKNLKNDLNYDFICNSSKQLAKTLLESRKKEVETLRR